MEYAEPKYKGEPTVESLANGLATLGRYGDSFMVHAAEGETVVPREVLDANPGLKNQLLWQMKMMGIENPNRYVVGSEFNSINPVTGQPEFFFKKIFKAVKKIFKKVLPVAAPIIGNMIAPGIGGPIASALSAKLTGGSWGDAFKQAALAYGAQTVGSGIMGAMDGGGASGFFEGLKQGAMAPITAAGNLFSSGPTNPLQQGIFGNVNQGTRGFNTETLLPRYDAQGGAQSMFGIKADPPFGTVQPSGNLAQASGSAAASGARGESLLGGLGGKALAAGIPAALAFAMSPEVEEQMSSYPPGDSRRNAYDQYKQLSPSDKQSERGYDLLRQAGISPQYDYQQLATSTGLTPAQARAHQMRRYGYDVAGAGGGLARGGMVNGPGTGTSDSIPAMLSDGEFVFTERAVDGAGGAGRMYELMRQFERAG